MSCMTEVERRIYENCRNVAHGRETNFESVTSSPEALAEFAEHFANCSDDCPVSNKNICEYKCKKCKEALLAWLKQESE